jgi:hypothetical protein
LDQQDQRHSHPFLPASAFRLYHPGYLVRSQKRWAWIAEIAAKITGAMVTPPGVAASCRADSAG